MTRRPHGLFCAILLIGAGLLLGTSPIHRCTLAPWPIARNPDATHFIAVAAPDSVLAGPGSVKPTGAPGHYGDGRERRIYGQVVHIDRFAGADSMELALAFEEQGANRAVVVPWDYDPACQTTFWRRSARWVPLGEAGMYVLGLRRRSEWADGLPTFDALSAARHPYPLGLFFQQGYLGADSVLTGRSLTAAEYFDLYRGLPEEGVVEEDPERGLAIVMQWEEAYPQLAETYPATTILASVKRSVNLEIRSRSVAGIFSPLTGTYRFTFSLTGQAERPFYARTYDAPSSPWFLHPEDSHVGTTYPPPSPDGYYIGMASAVSPDSLPEDCETSREFGREVAIGVLQAPDEPAHLRREWVGFITPHLPARQFAADSVLWRFALDAFYRSSERSRDNLPAEAPARFIRDEGGSVRIEQTIRLDDGRELVIRGSRISEETLACS